MKEYIRKKFVNLVLSKRKKHLDFRVLKVPFVTKGIPHSLADAQVFGVDVYKYDFWRPHMCAVCCISCHFNATHSTDSTSLSSLIDTCVEEGVYTIKNSEEIKGAFHYPLARVMRKMGIPTKVVRNIEIDRLIDAVDNGKIVFLSINLAKLPDSEHIESHLIVVYEYSPVKNEFRVHDCASVLSPNGDGVFIHSEKLARYSNKRGLIVG